MKFRNLCICLPLVLAVFSCGGEPSPPKFADIRFTQEPPIRLAVGQMSLISEFRPSFQAPEVEHEFAVPPQRALENLCRDRLQAVAPESGRTARFIIEDASIRESELPRTHGIRGVFTIDQAERYDGRVAVRVEIIDENGAMVRTAFAEAKSTRSVAEGTTLNERDQAWYDMSQELVRSLDQALEQQINASFYPYKL